MRRNAYPVRLEVFEMNLKYSLGKLLAIPFLPLMYWQGKKIKSSVPRLAEARGNSGDVGLGRHREIRLLAIGESTIAGVGVSSHRRGFTGALARYLATRLDLNVHWKVYARSGYTVKMVRKKLIPKIVESEADLVILGLGGNDAFTLNSPAQWSQEIRRLIKDLRSKFGDIPLIFIHMPPIKEFPAFTATIKFFVGNLVEILGNELAQIAHAESQVFFPEEKITLAGWSEKYNEQSDISNYFSDGVHPSEHTYQVWARDVAEFICDKPEITNALSKAK